MMEEKPTPISKETPQEQPAQPVAAAPQEAPADDMAGDETEAAEPVENKPRKKKNWFARHKVISIVLVLLAVIFVIVFWQVKNSAKKASAATSYQFVRTTTLKKTSLNDSVTVNGTVTSGDNASVTVADAAKLYKVDNVNVEVGDTVKEGDVIATLDTSDLQKEIESAQQTYNDTLQSAQTSYSRAVDDYNTSVTQHENNLIDLQAKVDTAKTAVDQAQTAKDNAESSYNAAAATYNQVKAAYDQAQGTVTTFQAAYDAAATTRDNSLNALNAAISNYQTAYTAAQNEYNGNGNVEPTGNSATLVALAQDMINAYCLYNGNDAVQSSDANVVNIEALKNQIAELKVNADSLHDGGIAYNDSAVGICAAAEKNLTDAKNAVSNASLGYNSYDEIAAAFTKADTALTQAQTALDQAKTGLDSSQSQVTSAEQAYDSEKNYSTLKAKKQTMEDTKTKLEQARRTPDSLTTLQNTLADCTLTATMSGTITALNATVGSVCTAAVATIQDTDALTVQVSIPANDMPGLTTGQSCSITSDATGDTEIPGTLTQIDPVAGEDGTFGAKVRVNGEAADLLIGIQAEVEIIKNKQDNVYTVPIDAVATAESGQTFVYRSTGGTGVDMTFEEVDVTVGDANDYYTIIASPELADGDVIRSSADLTQGIESADNTADPFAMESGAAPAEGEMSVTVGSADAPAGGGPDGGGAPDGGGGGNGGGGPGGQ